MASGGGKWEKVGKGGKAVTNKSGGHKTHKNVTKETDKAINGSHLVLQDVVKTSQTKFSGFNEDSSTTTTAKGAPPTATAAKGATHPASSAGSGQGKKQQSIHHKKKPQQRNRDPTISLRDALDQLDPDDIREHIQLIKEQYADEPLSWFKELIGYFKQHLPVHDAGTNEPIKLSHDVREVVISCWHGLPDNTLELFFIHCLNAISTESRKGGNTVTMVLLVELIKSSHPSVVDNCTEVAQVMLQSCISRPRESLPLLRAILLDNSQQRDMQHGIKAWSIMLLPLLRSPDNVPRQLITFSVNYSHEMFAEQPHPLALPLTTAEYVSVLQTAPPPQIAADNVMLDRFSQLMLNISKCVLKLKDRKPQKCLEVLLWILEKHNEPDPPQQLLQSAILCVSYSTQCVKVWRNHHGNQANRLMVKYISLHWDETKDLANQNECLDELLATLRSPNMVTMEGAPWKEPIKTANQVVASSSYIATAILIVGVLLGVAVLLGNQYCHHGDKNKIFCIYFNSFTEGIKWIIAQITIWFTSLNKWLLGSIPYWGTVSNFSHQVVMVIINVYTTSWKMLLSLWQLLLSCWDQLYPSIVDIYRSWIH